MNTQEQPVTASLVAEAQRLDFLPAYFGPRLMMRGEALVYAWLRRLCERYSGAYWHYYTLSDGGFYMAPDLADRLEIEVDGNGFRGELWGLGSNGTESALKPSACPQTLVASG